ncbi:hypothetical protein SLEP1_g41967 [Rubroshorea leprosula]|uniref:Zinc finger PHD-type domain-containing protein n=1 Tax=Rubroshorea leprosula TaxID=152421 RepID=A0AAV5L8P4_9ROSI|nr:hypothetical protein SLEP1_g41967 [Rubroshorea leprosula]
MEPKNFLHEHPLHFFEEWSNVHSETSSVNCSSGCGQPISTQFYACIDCKFFLHKSCSELPLNITHPFHDKHPLILLSDSPYESGPAVCNFCDRDVDGFVYHCSSCQFDLDIKCALLPEFLNGEFPKVDHHFHVEHPFFFIENLSHEVELDSSRHCSVCFEQLSSDSSFYTCLACELFLHKSCSETELPLNINHPFHDKHTLTLTLVKVDRVVRCQFCQESFYSAGLLYHCSSCNFNLDIKCALLPEFLNGEFPKVDHHFHVEHPLFFIENLGHEVELDFSHHCSVCFEQLSSDSSFYTCLACELFLHKSCSETELPLNINHPFHEKHTLALTLVKVDGVVRCQFCQESFYSAGLLYHCSSCNFDLDIKCALLPEFLNGDFPKVDHHIHVEHPLFFIQKNLISDGYKVELRSHCFVCPDSLSGSSFYYCPECQLFLHKSCAFEEGPLKINHSFHDEHALTLKKGSPSWWSRPACNFCLNVIKEFRYSCSSCEFHLDDRCALHITKDLPKRDHRFSHDHPLAFVQILSDEVKINASCSVCSKPLLGTSFYNCPDCRIFLHKECEAELWAKIEHVAHPEHPLSLVFSAHYTCNFCQEDKRDVKKIGYKCPSCAFYIHHECTLPRFFPKSKIHDHQLSPFMRKNPFICDACGGAGDNARYFCLKCSIMIHRDCIFLPKLIKFKLHNHHILGHNYRFPQKVGEKWTCQFCFKKVVAEYGSYKCLHSDCTYVLHGSCVKKNEGRLYIEVESENEESDDEASSSSSCAVALGDKIDHFSHEHELVLDKEEIIMNGDKKCCDGCALPILEAAYSCPQPECNFSLHKACAQIGEDKPHWASRDPVPVIMESHFECRFCKYDCSGFRSIWKGVDGNRRKICHRCSEIDFITKHEAHDQHFLFCDEDHKGPCSGCGEEMGEYGGYRCTLAEEEENCKFFALDYRCMTRPLTAEHRFHHHPLKLIYEDPYKDDDGDPFQHMCEICEDRRDPKLWFYRCDECDFDAHPDCVLGDYPFIKRGSIYYYYIICDSHQEPLRYFQSEKYPYPKCHWCGDPCKDQLALNCPHSDCPFALHLKCRDLYDSASIEDVLMVSTRWD